MHESRNEFLEHLYSEYYDSVFRLCIVIAGYDKQHYGELTHAALMDARGMRSADIYRRAGGSNPWHQPTQGLWALRNNHTIQGDAAGKAMPANSQGIL